jgi:hypothetical protein
MAPEWLGFIILLTAILIWYFEVVPPLGATLLIRIRSGKPATARGSVPSRVLGDLAEILREAGVDRGYIAKNGDGRIVFSRSIPETVRQALRNVVVNG